MKHTDGFEIPEVHILVNSHEIQRTFNCNIK